VKELSGLQELCQPPLCKGRWLTVGESEGLSYFRFAESINRQSGLYNPPPAYAGAPFAQRGLMKSSLYWGSFKYIKFKERKGKNHE